MQPKTNPTAPVRSVRAFTLVEMIMVVGVLVLLIAAIVPMLSKATKTARRTRALADLQAIATGLEAYRGDHRDYPRLSPSITDVSGAELLCWALLAPGPSADDGNDGPGFRIRGAQGQVYGPYLQPDKFHLQNLDATMATTPPPLRDSVCAILDAWEHPIYYCPATPNADPTRQAGWGAAGYVDNYGGAGPRPLYDRNYLIEPTSNAVDTSAYHEATTPQLSNKEVVSMKTMRLLLGDNHDPANPNGYIDGNERTLTLPYLLWSAGPNGFFGYDYNKTPAQTDDITNFLQ